METLLNSLKSDLATGGGLKQRGKTNATETAQSEQARGCAVMARTAPAGPKPGGRSKQAPEILGKGISLGELGIFCC